MKVLVTGGAGYLGSVTARALEQAGHVPVVLDSLLSGPRRYVGDRIFYEGDIADRVLLRRIAAEHPDLDATIHMAARIVVPESVREPYLYYRDNVAKSLEMFDELTALGLTRVIFSSTASLYALKPDFEVSETDAVEPTSPYARTKRMIEQVMEDLSAATAMRSIILRYFHPIGADPDLVTGYHLRDATHVVPLMAQAALGQRAEFTLTGTEHPTRDGTGIRDYIHVWDLARAHVRAVEAFDDVLAAERATTSYLNLGAGDGVTVRELLAAVERVVGRPVPVVEAPARPGDAAGAFANADKAARLLGWRTELSLDEAIASALAWGAKRQEILGYP
ncbi:UDP-glucose 4-epimerase GalE [Nocardioides sp.]|uniref:UDP-glucose 4-epimerase GalE n=1 Tax=Nocardioides sp. TaxID=35761 RepID=UPI0035153D55